MQLRSGFVIVLLTLSAPVMSATDTPREASSQVVTQTAGVPPAKGRLRFKSAGPVCMCGEGLSEKDIEAAMIRQGLSRAMSVHGSMAAEGRSNNAMGGESQMNNQNGGVAR